MREKSDMANAAPESAVEAQDTVKRNVIGILIVCVVLAVFLFSLFGYLRPY
ncbi:MAG TPA: hypothetical protein VHK24_09540 [Steroidobacter sp.]|nr:hypothetical protein [Steroidobacter sp.]